MDQNEENKIQNIVINFYDKNKKKILFFGIILLTILSLFILFKNNKEKENSLIAEKYIQANLLLSKEKKENAKILYEEIILSKNNFYSVLGFFKIFFIFIYFS